MSSTTANTASGCYFCGTQLGTLADGAAARVDGAHWTGTEYVRVALCVGCLHAGRLESAPRRPRQPRTKVVATDWNMLAAFHGAGKNRR